MIEFFKTKLKINIKMNNCKLVLCLVIALLGCGVLAEKFSYKGYKLIDITPKTSDQLELLAKWENNQDVTNLL